MKKVCIRHDADGKQRHGQTGAHLQPLQGLLSLLSLLSRPGAAVAWSSADVQGACMRTECMVA